MDNIIIYNTDDGAASVKLYADDGTVWLARAEIAALFQKDRSTISKHIKNIFAEGELDEKNNVHFLHIDSIRKYTERSCQSLNHHLPRALHRISRGRSRPSFVSPAGKTWRGQVRRCG